ncbi:MAG TPA: ATP-binding cassette domain-containing protein [Bacteroides sp.]|nr:ATP-binding cassette domain-containing protein [Bacteroides sp.]
MTIRFEKLIPIPLVEQDTGGSDIWESDAVLFEQAKKYIIQAPSGKGKTSLLSVIYGIRNDYHGEVYLDATDISTLSSREWSRLRKEKLSFIFQGLELFDDLTALENIQLKNSITGHKSLHAIMEMANLMGIGDFLHRKAGILSFGQQQRVAIIRALCQPFSYLLADECFSHIDRENSLIAYRLISRECDMQGAGLLLTSLHEPELMEADVQLKL